MLFTDAWIFDVQLYIIKNYLFWTCMHAKSLQSCLTLRPHGLSLPGSYVHGILQARILEWTAMPFSRGSSWPRNRTHVFYVSCIGRWVIYHWATWESPILLIHVYICRHCSWHQDISPNNTNQLLSWNTHSIVRKTGNKKQQKLIYQNRIQQKQNYGKGKIVVGTRIEFSMPAFQRKSPQ